MPIPIVLAGLQVLILSKMDQPIHRSDIMIGVRNQQELSLWHATGTAFRHALFDKKLQAEFGIQNGIGRSLISTKREGDAPVGTLESPLFQISRKYIGFKISGGNYEQRTCLNLVIDGKVAKSATGRRSDDLRADSWDVSQWNGKDAQLQMIDESRGDWGHINVDNIIQTDQPESFPLPTGPLYQEALRPQFHFTARQWTMSRLNPQQREEGWINDLNGLIYYEGEYHLFAQRWAKCWLHAVSKDLIHWTELQPAFWEEELDSGTQSGTCVIDYENTSGLGVDKAHPPMIAFWSRFDNKSQCLCYSLDKGRTWTRYAKNPLMDYPERDPKVFWYAPGKHWVMMLYGNGQYHILTSKNLLNWNDEKNPIDHSFECPDFFELPLDENSKNKKWVLIQGNGNYSIGTFNGTKFSEETQRHACDVGPNFYATQSWANNDTGDGRKIQTAWMRGADFPDMPFNQQISFPCELTLRSTIEGLRVFRKPIHEIESLRTESHGWKDVSLAPGQSLVLSEKGDLFQIKGEVVIPEGAQLTLNDRGEHVTLNTHSITSGTGPAPVVGSVKTFEILLDRTSIETFINDGEVSSTRFVLPKGQGITLTSSGGLVEIKTLSIYSLKSAWPKQIH